MRFHRNSQVVSQGVSGTHRDHAQRHAASGDALQDVVDGAIASACEDRVAAFENRLARLFRRIRTRLRARETDVHSGLAQNSLDLPQIVFALLRGGRPSARCTGGSLCACR